MRKYLVALVLVFGAVATLAVAAIAGSGTNNIRAESGLTGYEETPQTLSTTGNGTFEAKIAGDEQSFDWELTFEALESPVTQAHIHFGARALNGGISVWLCKTAATAANAPPGTADCPAGGGTVTGTADADDVIGPTGQGIAPREFAELIAAMRTGATYANVHSTVRPGGEIRGQLNDD